MKISRIILELTKYLQKQEPKYQEKVKHPINPKIDLKRAQNPNQIYGKTIGVSKKIRYQNVKSREKGYGDVWIQQKVLMKFRSVDIFSWVKFFFVFSAFQFHICRHVEHDTMLYFILDKILINVDFEMEPPGLLKL